MGSKEPTFTGVVALEHWHLISSKKLYIEVMCVWLDFTNLYGLILGETMCFGWI